MHEEYLKIKDKAVMFPCKYKLIQTSDKFKRDFIPNSRA